MVNSEILKVSGFEQVKVILDASESIFLKADSQLVVDNALKVTADLGNVGIMGGVMRAFSAGNVFLKKIYNDTSAQHVAIFSSIMPGTVQAITVKSGESWTLASNIFLGCTTNLKVASRLNYNLANLLGGAGLVFTEISLPQDGSEGTVWISSLGGTYARELNENKDFRIHAGLFMASPTSIYEKIETVGGGSLGSTLNGGGLMMSFANCDAEGIVYLQTVNIAEFFHKIANQIIDTRDEYSYTGGEVAGNAIMAGVDGISGLFSTNSPEPPASLQRKEELLKSENLLSSSVGDQSAKLPTSITEPEKKREHVTPEHVSILKNTEMKNIMPIAVSEKVNPLSPKENGLVDEHPVTGILGNEAVKPEPNEQNNNKEIKPTPPLPQEIQPSAKTLSVQKGKGTNLKRKNKTFKRRIYNV